MQNIFPRRRRFTDLNKFYYDHFTNNDQYVERSMPLYFMASVYFSQSSLLSLSSANFVPESLAKLKFIDYEMIINSLKTHVAWPKLIPV